MPWKIVKPKTVLKHNGEVYQEGDYIPDECAETMKPFVEYVQGRERKPATTPAPELSNPEQPVKQYELSEDELLAECTHTGGGWYTMPNGDRVQGKDNAIAKMRELHATD